MVNKAEVEKVKLESKLESLRINGEASKQVGKNFVSLHLVTACVLRWTTYLYKNMCNVYVATLVKPDT